LRPSNILPINISKKKITRKEGNLQRGGGAVWRVKEKKEKKRKP